MKRHRILITAATIMVGAFATQIWQGSHGKSAVLKSSTHLDSVKNSSPLAKTQSMAAPVDEANPSWMIPFGREFWKVKTGPASGTGKGKEPRHIDLQGAMERVSHALKAGLQEGLPGVEAQTYSAAFDMQGLRFSPYRPIEARTVSTGSSKEFTARNRPESSAPALLPDATANATFKTVAIRQGENTLYEAGKPSTLDEGWKVEGNTAQALRSKDAVIVEHYEALKEGVAVTWILREKLAGKGPVQIQAEVQGLHYSAQSEHGHHFADAGGMSRMRVGKVTAVDATGQRWDLAMQFANDRLLVEVPQTVLAAAVYPLAIDPVIGPEFGVDQAIAFPLQGYMPAIASNGQDYLVAWKMSLRVGSDDYQEQIRATRIGRDGLILDPTGILVAAGVYSVNFPSVASDGNGFLVTWADSRQWDRGNNWTLQIYGARVSASGEVLEPDGIWLSHGTPSTSYRNAVAGNSNGYLVVWEDLRNAGTNTIGIVDIYGTRVTAGGTVLDYAGIAVCTASNNQTGPAIASSAGKFLVAWSDSRGKSYDPYIRTDYTAIYGAMVGDNGVVEQPDGFLINDGPWNQTVPTVAANGSDFFVAWEDDRNASGPPWPGNSDIFGTRVSPTGVVLDPDAIPLATAPGTQSAPSAAFDGSHWFVAWEDGRNATSSISKWDISAARIANDGTIASPANWVIATNTSSSPNPVVARNGSDMLLAWNADREIFRPFATGIMGARMRAGIVLDLEPQVLSIQGGSEILPRAAWNGSVYLLAWTLQPAQPLSFSSPAILGARLSATGQLLDPAGIRIATLPNAEQMFPAVAANGQDFFVVWADARNSRRDIYGTLITGSGQVVSTNGAPICRAAFNQTSPRVAANGEQFLVAWMDFRDGGGANVAADVYGARISSSGAVLDTDGFAISTAPRDQYLAAVAGNGSHWLVTWTDSRLATDRPWVAQVMGARVNAAGQVLEPDGISIDPNPKSIQSVDVAAHGSDFFVGWMEQPNSEKPVPAWGTLVSDSGVVATPGGSLVASACCEAFNLGVNETGEGYLVTWHSIPLEVLEENEEEEPLPVHFLGVRIRSDGTLHDMLPLDLTPSPALRGPAEIAGGGDEFLVVYSAPTAVNRLQVRAARLSLGLPSPWQEHSISQGQMEGSAAFSAVGVSLVGAGAGIGGRSDSFHFLHQTLSGDGQLTARFNRWFGSDPNAVAGIMLRDNLEAGSRAVFLGLNAQGQTLFERRKNPNGRPWTLKRPSTTLEWLRLTRRGNAISAWVSPDGHSWTFLWIARINMSSSIEAGLAISSGETNNPAGALFDHVEVAALSPSPVSLAPAGGTVAIQVGSPVSGLALDDENGAQLLVYGAAGTTTVLEGSADLQTWTELGHFSLSDMPMDYEEEVLPKRFYRARQISP